MDDKPYVTFHKRKKTRANAKVSREKIKKNFLRNEKFIRLSTISKSSTKKTFLHTLFKSFIKPYNEKNTAFYSILCIINNIYKCHYFSKHRCLICKPLHERSASILQEGGGYPDCCDGEDIASASGGGSLTTCASLSSTTASITASTTATATFPYDIYYNLRKINLIESGKLKSSASGGKSEGSRQAGEVDRNQSTQGKESSETEPNRGMLLLDMEKRKITEGGNESESEVRNEVETRVTMGMVKAPVEGKNAREYLHPENKTSQQVDATKTNALNNKPKSSAVVVRKNVSITNKEVSPIKEPIKNFISAKLNLTNVQHYYFLSHNKEHFEDPYHFDVFEKINIFDKILLDLNQSEIHPNVLRTGIFFNKYLNTTHNDRNVDLLTALKSFIKDYSLPPYEPINRHMKVVIDKEINYIIMCKKHSISMGEVIRWFKNMITEHIGKNVLEQTKVIITNNINNYIRTKIVMPSIHISNYVAEHIITDNDILLIYTFDYDIYLSIVKAKRSGKKFQIILVDSEPYKNSYDIKLYTKLGIPVTYTLIGALFYNIKNCTKVLLGIDAIIHNSVYAYVGTSIICMMAHLSNVHVYIACETYKISNKIIIDSFSINNINNNLDIYNYIYMHHHPHHRHHSHYDHYRHQQRHHHQQQQQQHAASHKGSPQMNKSVDQGVMFNRKLNTFINSYADISSTAVLFNNGEIDSRRSAPSKPLIKYFAVEAGKKRSGAFPPSSRRSKHVQEKVYLVEGTPPPSIRANPNGILLKGDPKINCQPSEWKDHPASSHPEVLKTNNDHFPSSCNAFLKDADTTHNGMDTSTLLPKQDDVKREIPICTKQEYSEREEEASVSRNSDVGMRDPGKNVKIFTTASVLTTISTSTVGSTKGILKQPGRTSNEEKNEKSNPLLSSKQNCANLPSPDKNFIKKNKVFFNLKSGKSTSPPRFSSHICTPSNNLSTHNDTCESEEEKICCNSICDSICTSIGNMNVKNVCTDTHNETNLFSSVQSHIRKINSTTDKSFYVANICNDVTPLKHITYIVTEMGLYTSANRNALKVFVQNNF
ncbi:initiation factor 2 subunit family, putative [Plasmodium knowlesi strain H]|uniref:Translation initiation factor eIF2B subunit delta n=3 Tax=Plasmodium knowlesi TaxID=5850 RepID=A0A5K1VQS2_PLAKH|nr:translation initiation factor eIF-2B subunit delta, putative [Plasmodium knowlesi strain H]OTN65909.1 putative Initiation factor 2 subunit family [Plasmodium knowlesi]CAA9987780.1 translation initiation factor eIF-2B subunit delta, putative [Plasmodium knowlesi strain H]SBO27108.1 initiation factor 2 subunit family, putative [Plasmodium knowlesi strain H]SBO29417.1 initiation factor 2 subunit family, putative [Plasmodium knowlesi strain H]VVS77254.1 translation initiation factor eIF-2B subu|eukprot:XP_002258777.1 initiation factor 2 subunit family, putative [Plasmodium knowlesi strain H]